MFSDTHFHFKTMDDSIEAGAETLKRYAAMDPYFAMDIGTHSDDLMDRLGHLESCISAMDSDSASKVEKFFRFSAGIWPSVPEIESRLEGIRVLEKQIESFSNAGGRFGTVAAIGECGLDHHWNPSNPDARDAGDFSDSVYRGERELFLMQLELAERMDLPVVVHSRDAFEDTLSCLDEAGWHRGIIHCYSYGINEARKFLDRGWYIAFGGSTTYAGKSRIEEMHALLNYVPDDRILLETDAPYLSPVPLRGKPNSPLNISHTYAFIAGHRGVEVERLCECVDSNVRTLFRLG
ncbi:MAG: TatD family hydrolase [Treponema sp.]|nr:TatD family hydrolase [Treponema sp.]